MPARFLVKALAVSPVRMQVGMQARGCSTFASQTRYLFAGKVSTPLSLNVNLQPTPVSHRSFHATRRRQDVFFVAFPALKSTLLSITRVSLLFLPFVFRYKSVPWTG
jgi:hypothetical protein